MDVEALYSTAGDDAVVLSVHVQPGAGRSSVVGRHGDALKLKVGAPPEAGRANDACASLLAETFGVAISDVSLASGDKSRSKTFKLSGVDLDEFRRRMELVVEGGAAGPGPEARSPGRSH
ncbi:MAG TPA: DUF167 domain-containing protein [Acidimicrobiales bacterium]|nr:DUF167 domain-containing protein [Acidimicrobiales bacterium]